jgi:hypothetical protein
MVGHTSCGSGSFSIARSSEITRSDRKDPHRVRIPCRQGALGLTLPAVGEEPEGLSFTGNAEFCEPRTLRSDGKATSGVHRGQNPSSALGTILSLLCCSVTSNAADRADKVWGETEIAALLSVASKEIKLALVLALWTGQRQGDLLRLPWSSYDGGLVRSRQSKTGRRITMPAGARLKVLFDGTERRSPLILTNSYGRPWTSDGFRTSWSKACARAAVSGLTFHDLRGSAVVRLALAEATVPQIATFAGHSLKDVEAILDTHYLGRDIQVAEAAVLKLEKRTKL